MLLGARAVTPLGMYLEEHAGGFRVRVWLDGFTRPVVATHASESSAREELGELLTAIAS